MIKKIMLLVFVLWAIGVGRISALEEIGLDLDKTDIKEITEYRESATKIAEKFFSQLPDRIEEIKEVKLEFLAKAQYGIPINIKALMEMKRVEAKEGYPHYYEAKLAITSLEGADPIGMLFVFTYKTLGQMIPGLRKQLDDMEIEIKERLLFAQGRFFTVDIEEIRDENKSVGKKMFKAVFANGQEKNQIIFYPDKRSERTQIIHFDGQVGPVAGFFNYIFRYQTDSIRTVDISECGVESTADGRKPVKLIFCRTASLSNREIVKSQENDDGLYRRISFPEKNFFGILKGDILFSEFTAVHSFACSLPTVVLLDGIVDSGKRKEKLLKLNADEPSRSDFREILFKEEDILLMKKVKVILNEATVTKVTP